MKERPPSFQFYPRQFSGDDQVMGMDLEAVGAHILLICAAASSPEGCRIDADEYAIRMRLRNPSDEAWQLAITTFCSVNTVRWRDVGCRLIRRGWG